MSGDPRSEIDENETGEGEIEYGEIDYADDAEVERVARLHERAPLDWIDGYRVRDEAVVATRARVSDAGDDPGARVLAARDAGGRLIGFHWIAVVDEGDDRLGHIHSLWVDPAHRRHGVARALKRRGEAWLRERGATRVRTEVFYVNRTMIEFNLREGFVPGQVEMTKEL